MARNQQLIDEILEQEEPGADHSLQAQALNRAVKGEIPRTLTPWEWEQWYAENGVPETHHQADTPPNKPWWRRWL